MDLKFLDELKAKNDIVEVIGKYLPLTRRGKLIFGVGCGLITSAIRFFGVYPEGVSFSILIMNIITPLIDRYVRPQPFGAKVKKTQRKNREAV